MSKKCIIISFVILFILLITGCEILKNGTLISITPSPWLPTMTITQIKNTMATKTNTQALSFSPSLTPLPSKRGSTSTFILQEPTITMTPAPTLSEIQRMDLFSELIRDNDGCKLPCWWEIYTGLTTWNEVQNKILYMGATIGNYNLANGAIYHGIGGFNLDSPDIINNIGFYEDNGIVEAINIEAVGYEDKTYFRNLWNSYSPNQILATYGLPTEIYIGVGSGPGEINEPGSGLLLKYDNKFMVLYSIRPLEVDEQGIPMYRICPSWQDNVWGPKLYVFILSNDSSISLEEYVVLISSINLKPYISIKEAAGISVDDFYNRFSPGNGPACFDTPQDLWK